MQLEPAPCAILDREHLHFSRACSPGAPNHQEFGSQNSSFASCSAPGIVSAVMRVPKSVPGCVFTRAAAAGEIGIVSTQLISQQCWLRR